MPDLMGHLLIGLVLAELLNVKKKSIVVMGALMPDLLSKIHLAYFYLGVPPVISFVSLHTPFMMLLFSITISLFFRHDNLRAIAYFNLGAASHFLSDLSIRHFTDVGTPLLFPFSRQGYSLNLIWPEQSIYVLVIAALAYASIRYVKMSPGISARLFKNFK